MTFTIHVELESPGETQDLIEFLATRGLTATTTDCGDHCELEIGYLVDPEERLRQEFDAALTSWLETRGRPLVPVADAEHHYVLRPPGD
jgi:hypothetical protein